MSEDLREDIGRNLGFIQAGLSPEDIKPMPSVGSGVYEMRKSRRQHSSLLLRDKDW